MQKDVFFFGEWQVDPNSNSVNLGKKNKQLEPKAMDDAMNIGWFLLDELPPLAFDHEEIIEAAIKI
mgnify:CR=1 FL=1